ncbi:MAG: O-linked N-acetylglucosamine transferase, SPINDLY family protein [Acidobacteriaceae bacterium]
MGQEFKTAKEHHQAGRFQDAERLYRQILQVHPDNTDVLKSLWVLAQQTGRISLAVEMMRRAVVVKPLAPDFHYNLGIVLAAQGRGDEAIVHYERAVALKPSFAEAHNNLGIALAAQGRGDEAIVHYERAVALKPKAAEAHNNLGNVLAAQGRGDEAIVHYERAVALKPSFAEAHNNLGIALAAQGRGDEAIVHYERAVALNPKSAEVHNNLGVVLTAQGWVEEAIVHYERAIACNPEYVVAHSNLLMTLNYLPDRDPASIFAAHVDFARRREEPLAGMRRPLGNDRSRERRLKIGYVSSDFRQHAVAHFIETLWAHHNHELFEVFGYYNHMHQDEVTHRLRAHADHWRVIARLSYEQAAEQIRNDRIDLLVDLGGHTGTHLLVFAHTPAPIQVTWLGYPNTTGLSSMNYRITDAWADPPGQTEQFHTEQLIRLPDCFSCYQPPQDAPEVAPLPALRNGYVTFGSFNLPGKITPEVIRLWAQILHAIPGSRLILKYRSLTDEAVQQRVRRAFSALDVAPEQLELLGHSISHRSHLEHYHRVDIGLDPFPYNGATTTCDALWMGVPVITLAGHTHVARVGVSQLSNLGLTQLIAYTPEDYIGIARHLASHLDTVATLRTGLRPRMAASPLAQADRFARNMEQAYRAMWHEWCQRQ